MEGGILDTVKKHWHLVLAVVAFLLWFSNQVSSASSTMADITDSIQHSQEKIVDLEEDVEKHEESVGHPQVNERLIRVETELIHINRSQSEGFQDIKLQLNTMQEDIKEITRNP